MTLNASSDSYGGPPGAEGVAGPLERTTGPVRLLATVSHRLGDLGVASPVVHDPVRHLDR